MSATNVGNQTVYFNYKKALTGDIFNKSQQTFKRKGTVSGMTVAKLSDVSVSVATGVFNISDGTHMVTINKASSSSITVDNTKNYIVARYTYSEAELWYAEFLHVATVLTNDVLLATLNWTGSTLTSVSMVGRHDANIVYDTEVYITANSHNAYFKDLILSGVFGNSASGNLWLNLIDNGWLGDNDTSPLEEMLGGMIPVLGFDTTNRYLYWFLKSGASVDINFKLKYVTNSTNAGNVVMKLEYMTLTDGLTDMDSLIFVDSTAETIATPGAINVFKETTTSTLKIPSAAMTVPDKLVLCRLTRDQAAGGDTFTGTIKFLQIVPVVL